MQTQRKFVITGRVPLASLKSADAKRHAANHWRFPPTQILLWTLKSLVCLAVVSVPLSAADPQISAAERTQLLKWLDESHAEFFAAIDGVSDEQWKWKPAPERWSVGETAEHIVLAEALLLDFARKAMAAPPNPDWEEQTKGKTELLVRVMPSRQGKAVAPEPIVPHEGLSRAQVKERFEKQRIDFVNLVGNSQAAFKEHTAVHPFPVFGTLNAYQWLIYAPLHTMRHDQQIAEVKATNGYPK
ncbi:MAG TPA: DinB family protein [Bryobacteraceae bacterium]|nr:DinB family protein [Bryobacteraceae bacterium]